MKWEKENINRITVEFKLYASSRFAVSLNCILIESQWNLNGKKLQIDYHKYNILIESQWNLNYGEYELKESILKILIESQWNLNKQNLERKLNVQIDINRITVEFK